MSNSLGERYRVHIFGQSHAPAIGAVSYRFWPKMTWQPAGARRSDQQPPL